MAFFGGFHKIHGYPRFLGLFDLLKAVVPKELSLSLLVQDVFPNLNLHINIHQRISISYTISVYPSIFMFASIIPHSPCIPISIVTSQLQVLWHTFRHFSIAAE